MIGECKIPPPGWRCTREPGHDGPCAALRKKMTKEERAVASAIKNYEKVSKRAYARLGEARKQLGDSCTHPDEHVTTYTWEHDNGYGRQTKMQGLMCQLCMKRKSWKTMGGWHDASELRSNDDW